MPILAKRGQTSRVFFPFFVQWAKSVPKCILNSRGCNFEDAEIFELSSLNYKLSVIYTVYYEGALYKDKPAGLTHTSWTNEAED